MEVAEAVSVDGDMQIASFLHPTTMEGGGILIMPKYSKKAQDEVEKAMHEKNEGKLRSGSGKKVTSNKQAVAIGLHKAREKGAKVPKKKS